jgi:hypothetical protein
MNVKKLAPVAKTVAACVAAGLGAFATAASDGAVTPTEWMVIAATALGSSGLVYTIPNAQGE